MQTGGPQLYEIFDGVRRAKAAHMAGHSSIRAQLVDVATGRILREIDAPLEELRLPHRRTIPRITPADEARWRRIVRGAQQAVPIPPIMVTLGGRGVKVEHITFDLGVRP